MPSTVTLSLSGPVGTGDASAQNFELEPTSPAINGARSEIGPNTESNAIYPTVRSDHAADRRPPHPDSDRPQFAYRYRTAGPPWRRVQFGFGFIGSGSLDPRQIVTLPGSGYFSFPDEWAPVVTADIQRRLGRLFSDRNYNYGPSAASATSWATSGPQPGNTGTGYGSNPFIDIGAYQYVNLNPPQVTGVTETPTQGATPVNFYTRGRNLRRQPDAVDDQHHVQRPDSPSTLNANTVQLVDLGSNPSQPLNQDINLSGKISYMSATDTLVINLAAAGLTLGTDAYQITLFGSGSPVITNLQGVALDGENTVWRPANRGPTGAPFGQRLPRRQLLRLVHHQHDAAVGRRRER